MEYGIEYKAWNGRRKIIRHVSGEPIAFPTLKTIKNFLRNHPYSYPEARVITFEKSDKTP